MNKDKNHLLSPIFLKHQAEFEKNPRSRVFAPLAETYRKLGMHDKAMEILSQGIRYHPSYVMGYLGLAFCYYDLRQFSLAYSTLRVLVETNRDNIRLQKLFADVCLELGHKEEALNTYKYLLFINPRAKDIADIVSNLEREIEEQYRPHHQPIYIPESEFENDRNIFDVERLEPRPKSSDDDFDDWMAVDLGRHPKKESIESHPAEHWNVKKIDRTLDAIPVEKVKEEKPVKEKTETPLVTHTLVDLYCGQGYFDKALEVLEKILVLNPSDEKTIKKLAEIKQLIAEGEEEEVTEVVRQEKVRPVIVLEEASEEDGRKELMSVFDREINLREDDLPEECLQVEPSEKARLLEKKLTTFLEKIQKRALDYQARV